MSDEFRSPVPGWLRDFPWPWSVTDHGQRFAEADDQEVDERSVGQALDVLDRCLEWIRVPEHRSEDWTVALAWLDSYDAFQHLFELAPRLGELTWGKLRVTVAQCAEDAGVTFPITDRDLEIFARNVVVVLVLRIAQDVTIWIERLSGALSGSAELDRLFALTRHHLRTAPDDLERAEKLLLAVTYSGRRASLGFLREIVVDPEVSEWAHAYAREKLTWAAWAIEAGDW